MADPGINYYPPDNGRTPFYPVFHSVFPGPDSVNIFSTVCPFPMSTLNFLNMPSLARNESTAPQQNCLEYREEQKVGTEDEEREDDYDNEEEREDDYDNEEEREDDYDNEEETWEELPDPKGNAYHLYHQKEPPLAHHVHSNNLRIPAHLDYLYSQIDPPLSQNNSTTNLTPDSPPTPFDFSYGNVLPTLPLFHSNMSLDAMPQSSQNLPNTSQELLPPSIRNNSNGNQQTSTTSNTVHLERAPLPRIRCCFEPLSSPSERLRQLLPPMPPAAQREQHIDETIILSDDSRSNSPEAMEAQPFDDESNSSSDVEEVPTSPPSMPNPWDLEQDDASQDILEDRNMENQFYENSRDSHSDSEGNASESDDASDSAEIDEQRRALLLRLRSPLPPDREVAFGDCPICLEPLGTGRVAATSCGHCFCENCLIRSTEMPIRCPTCRKMLDISNIIPLFLYEKQKNLNPQN